MSAAAAALVAVACALGGVSAFAAAHVLAAERRSARRRPAMPSGSEAARSGRTSPSDRTLAYCATLTRRLNMGTTTPLCPSVRSGRAQQARAGRRYAENALQAGCGKEVSTLGFCEARFRLGAAGCAAGLLAGSAFSPELAVALGAGGAVLGCTQPMRAVKRARAERALCAERHLSEMLEVVALGLRSGLTFDRSFALYGSHFGNEFARSCARAHRCWALGLETREESLAALAASYDCEALQRIVDAVVRGLRFGTALGSVLEDAAEQSRMAYRTALEERVAKAPVKMMLPTGTLILPAMLLLVMGPVLLEMAGGFR